MGETILLVDDEPALRRLLTRTLTARGYRVLEAENSVEALTVFAAQQNAVDLVVTDVGMPGWRGTELVEMLRLMRPAIKVIFISGYPDPSIAQEPHLQKPFSGADLLALVQHLLSLPSSV